MTIEEKQFVEIELWNPNATFRQLKDGNLYKLGFEVTPEVWKLFEQPTPGLRLKGILYVAQDDESDEIELQQAKANAASEKPKKEPKPKSPYGEFWRVMIGRGFFNSPLGKMYLKKLREQVAEIGGQDCPDNDDDLVRSYFCVASRSEIVPEQFAYDIGNRVHLWGCMQGIDIYHDAIKAQGAGA